MKPNTTPGKSLYSRHFHFNVFDGWGRLVHCMLYHVHNVKGGVHNVKGGMKYPDLTVYGQPGRTAGKT